MSISAKYEAVVSAAGLRRKTYWRSSKARRKAPRRKHRRVDIKRSAELAELADPLPMTFHRAFDELKDLQTGLEDVSSTGATRLLTSGGAPTAAEGAGTLAGLLRQAGGRITILPGMRKAVCGPSVQRQRPRSCGEPTGQTLRTHCGKALCLGNKSIRLATCMR